jgi:hypothetical protein
VQLGDKDCLSQRAVTVLKWAISRLVHMVVGAELIATGEREIEGEIEGAGRFAAPENDARDGATATCATIPSPKRERYSCSRVTRLTGQSPRRLCPQLQPGDFDLHHTRNPLARRLPTRRLAADG